jgi:pimeloyl-ACP methyl ester carboxylesterase
MQRVTSPDGIQIGYRTTGEGPPLLLVHGLLGDHARWAALQEYFEPHFTVHAIDRRGRGASGDGAGYDITREVEDVAAVVDHIA